MQVWSLQVQCEYQGTGYVGKIKKQRMESQKEGGSLDNIGSQGRRVTNEALAHLDLPTLTPCKWPRSLERGKDNRPIAGLCCPGCMVQLQQTNKGPRRHGVHASVVLAPSAARTFRLSDCVPSMVEESECR